MYRISIYPNDGPKEVLAETDNEDELRDYVDSCLNDIENKKIKTFIVSWLSKNRYQKPWWEE